MNEQEVIKILKAHPRKNSDLWAAWEMQHTRLDRVRAMFKKAQKKGLPVDPLITKLDEAVQYISTVQKELR